MPRRVSILGTKERAALSSEEMLEHAAAELRMHLDQFAGKAELFEGKAGTGAALLERAAEVLRTEAAARGAALERARAVGSGGRVRRASIVALAGGESGQESEAEGEEEGEEECRAERGGKGDTVEVIAGHAGTSRGEGEQEMVRSDVSGGTGDDKGGAKNVDHKQESCTPAEEGRRSGHSE